MLKPETINLIKTYLEQETEIKLASLNNAIVNDYATDLVLQSYKEIYSALRDFYNFINDMEE